MSRVHSRLQRVVGLLLVVGVLILLVGCGGTGPATLAVINNSGSDICGVYAVDGAADDGNWGDNLLGSTPLPNGQTFELQIAKGTYDLRAESCDGATSDKLDVPVDGRVEWTVVPG
jgi:hypothetical protein